MRTMRVTLAWIVGLLLAGTVAQAATPQLNRVLPRGGQRGTEIDLTLDGVRLEDAKEVMLYAPGITVMKLDVVNDKQVKAQRQD